MKYLINSTEMFRCDTEKEAEDFLAKLKENNSFDIVSSTIARKDVKSKGEVVDSWFRLTIKKVFNEEKEPISIYMNEED